jgi:8-oxo-dGTP diphosphatase
MWVWVSVGRSDLASLPHGTSNLPALGLHQAKQPTVHWRYLLKKQIVVVGAVIVRDELILCAQRGSSGALGGLWEFPGGKIEAGETPRQALEREIREELACRVHVGEELTTTTHEYDFGVVTLTTFYCTLVEGEPRLSEHQAVLWLPPGELGSIEWAPADVPAVQLIRAAEAKA